MTTALASQFLDLPIFFVGLPRDAFLPHISGDRDASVLDGVSKASGRAASDGVAFVIEDRELVIFAEAVLAAFVLQQHHVIRPILLHGDDEARATVPKRLDNLSRLRSGATLRPASENVASAAQSGRDFP